MIADKFKVGEYTIRLFKFSLSNSFCLSDLSDTTHLVALLDKSDKVFLFKMELDEEEVAVVAKLIGKQIKNSQR